MALLEDGAPASLQRSTGARYTASGGTRPTKRRLAMAGAGLAAAALVATAVLVPTLETTTSPVAAIGLHQTVASPLSASVRLTPTSWGTRIDMTCTYASGYQRAKAPYRLYVIDHAGHAWLVSSWRAGPGDVARTTGSSDLNRAQIASVQVRSSSGTVLLTGQA
jgi:hypothetical protein